MPGDFDFSHLEILQYFKYSHLPKDLQVVSKAFAVLAQDVAALPENPERSVALRKLLEAKDAAVRAAIHIPRPVVQRQDGPGFNIRAGGVIPFSGSRMTAAEANSSPVEMSIADVSLSPEGDAEQEAKPVEVSETREGPTVDELVKRAMHFQGGAMAAGSNSYPISYKNVCDQASVVLSEMGILSCSLEIEPGKIHFFAGGQQEALDGCIEAVKRRVSNPNWGRQA